MGGGGINVLVNVIIVDLVPQRERAKFSGIISLAGALGLAAGVLCGAALAQESWRWYVDYKFDSLYSLECVESILNIR